MRNFIEYNGISKCSYTDILYFKQITTDFTFCLPTPKPDIEQILKVWVKPCIVMKKIVATPVGISLEGQNLTGYKMMVSGDISYKVEYVVLDTVQSVNCAQGIAPFCGYVVLPANFNPNNVVTASAIVEDVYSEQIDLRCVYNNIMMLIVADIC